MTADARSPPATRSGKNSPPQRAQPVDKRRASHPRTSLWFAWLRPAARGVTRSASRLLAGTVAKPYEAPPQRMRPSSKQRVLAHMPNAIKAVQNDGGSEFMAEFELACDTRNG